MKVSKINSFMKTLNIECLKLNPEERPNIEEIIKILDKMKDDIYSSNSIKKIIIIFTSA